MVSDRQGNPLSGATPASAELYDQAIHCFNLYRDDPIALLDRAAAEAPDFAMAYIAKAWLYVTATEPEANRVALGLLEHARTLSLNERETGLLAPLQQVLLGNWGAAAVALDHHNARYPHDLLALQCGHLCDFYRANARDLRDRIARALPRWSAEMPGYSVLLGMYAFGLEECGQYDAAEAQGRTALDLEPQDCWAHHAVTHVMEMQGRAQDGLGWMNNREADWAQADNFFQVHNWWHKALFHLDLGQLDEALALYDRHLRPGEGSLALDLVDASALLWRLHLCGVALSDRWQAVADRWLKYADGKSYPFNDWHAVMAYLGAGREVDEAWIRAEMTAHVDDHAEVDLWRRTTGLDLVEGFSAFWHGDYAAAAERLQRARYIANTFGGSHAQRDVIDWTLMEALLRAGLKEMAQAVAHERLALKPHSPVNQGFLRRSLKVE